MALESLIELLPPPGQPIETGSLADWLRIERVIGTKLPQDYKDYVNTYGSGRIGNLLWPYSPFSRNHFLNLIDQIPITLDGIRVMMGEFGKEVCPYPLHPEPGGLLPWGGTDNGNTLFWQTTGNPAQWTIVIDDSDGIEYEHFQESTSDFLAKLLLGKITSNILPVDYLSQHVSFEPLG
jgi:hypothetical protein